MDKWRALIAEGGRFSVNAVAAPDADGVFVLKRTFFKRRQEAGRRLAGAKDRLPVRAALKNTYRGHPTMSCLDARNRASSPTSSDKMSQECNNVVLNLALNFINPVSVECHALGIFPDRSCGFFWNDAQVPPCGRRRGPLSQTRFGILCFRRPDIRHFRSRITRDHYISSIKSNVPPQRAGLIGRVRLQSAGRCRAFP